MFISFALLLLPGSTAGYLSLQNFASWNCSDQTIGVAVRLLPEGCTHFEVQPGESALVKQGSISIRSSGCSEKDQTVTLSYFQGKECAGTPLVDNIAVTNKCTSFPNGGGGGIIANFGCALDKESRGYCLTREMWSQNKKLYCCQAFQLGCPKQTEEQPKQDQQSMVPSSAICDACKEPLSADCSSALAKSCEDTPRQDRCVACAGDKNGSIDCIWKLTVFLGQCLTKSTATKADCLTKDSWSQDKKTFCCQTYQLGCQTSTTLKVNETEPKRDQNLDYSGNRPGSVAPGFFLATVSFLVLAI